MPFGPLQRSTPAAQHLPSFPAPAFGETDGANQSIAAQVRVKDWCEFTAGESRKWVRTFYYCTVRIVVVDAEKV